MPPHVPQYHRDLLEKEVAGVKPGDLDVVHRLFKAHKGDLKPVGLKMIDGLFRQLEVLHQLLDAPEHLDDRQQRVAIAALKYFLREEDHITDKYAFTGLVDDALVVEAAVWELHDALEERGLEK
mgnify:CR=1 FL=1